VGFVLDADGVTAGVDGFDDGGAEAAELVRSDVAHAVGELGDWDQAHAEYQQVLNAQVRVLGPDHPATRDTRASLAAAARMLRHPSGDDPRPRRPI
jgi:hypothetical protein